jgi:hypothetical protein
MTSKGESNEINAIEQIAVFECGASGSFDE